MKTSATGIILKTGSRGHLHPPRQRREELWAEFERSGLPATQFAVLAAVRYQTFAIWVQKRRKDRPGTQATEGGTQASPLGVEVAVGRPRATEPLRVLLPEGAVIEVAGGVHVPLAVLSRQSSSQGAHWADLACSNNLGTSARLQR